MTCLFRYINNIQGETDFDNNFISSRVIISQHFRV